MLMLFVLGLLLVGMALAMLTAGHPQRERAERRRSAPSPCSRR